jgi:hypothetical protein
MVKTIKLDQEDNFLYDPDTQTILPKYSEDLKNEYPNFKLRLRLPDESILTIDNENIKTEYGGNVFVQYMNDKYIIDDGYQGILCKAGYIVYDNYDIKKIYNKEEGIKLNDDIVDIVVRALTNIYYRDVYDIIVKSYNLYYQKDRNSKIDIGIKIYKGTISFNAYYGGYLYTIEINTISNIVKKNQSRKDNSLPFYPFTTDMDRYGTLYLTIFAAKNDKASEYVDKYEFPDDFVADLIKELGSDFHFVSQTIRKRITLFDEN